MQQRPPSSPALGKAPQPGVPAAPSKPVPLPLAPELLRQVGGGLAAPRRGW